MATSNANPFEKSNKDVDAKGMKEGSKAEEALDRRQAKAAAKSPFPKKK